MNQHFIPRVYLKNFAKPKGKIYQIDVYDKIKNKYFPTNIDNICSEKNIYTLEEFNEVAKNIFAIEKVYSDFLEPSYGKAYDILTNDNIIHISQQQRIDIILGILQLYYRNPSILQSVLTYNIGNLKDLYRELTKKNVYSMDYMGLTFNLNECGLDEIINIVTKTITNIFKEKHLSMTSSMVEIHETSIIEIEKIYDNSNFITSDNPLILENYFIDYDNPLLKTTKFSLPLNRKYLVNIYHDKTKNIHKIYREFTLAGNVNSFNQKIYNNSTRFIMCNENILNDMRYYTNFLNQNNNIESKIGVIELVLKNKEMVNQSPEVAKLLKYYYDIYTIEKHLSVEQEQSLMFGLQELIRKQQISKIKQNNIYSEWFNMIRRLIKKKING